MLAFGNKEQEGNEELQVKEAEGEALSEIEAPAERRKGCCSYCKHMLTTYNNFFLFTLGLQYFNNGAKGMTSLSYQYIFKNIY